MRARMPAITAASNQISKFGTIMREGLIRVSVSTIGANVARVRRSAGSRAPIVTASSASAGAPCRIVREATKSTIGLGNSPFS